MASFEQKTIKSFHAVKADTEEIKRSVNEWIIFLDGSLRMAKERVLELENRLAELEARQDTQWR